tara:strand:+ start:1664 stop:2095 length:432 start_codon:yes stop_codon:yes gene_type:complete
MKKITSSDLKELNIFKHYRILRKWLCKTNNIKEADFELLLYLDAIQYFSKQDFKDGVYSYSWDNRRWNRLLKDGWIIVWRNRNRTTQKYNIYKTSVKFKLLTSKMYRIILGEEDIIIDKLKKDRYINKVISKAAEKINKDKTR